MPAEKFSRIFSLRLCQNDVFRRVSNRGAKNVFAFAKARGPPPFLGSQEKSTALKGSGEGCDSLRGERRDTAARKALSNDFRRALPKRRFPA
jgi:hypothetical protein